MSPRPYVRPISSASWWLGHGRYVSYMAREVTCIAIGAYTAVLIVGLLRLSEGKAAFEAFVAAVQSPAGFVFHLVLLIAALYHTSSWFNVTPKAMPMQLEGQPVPDGAIVGAHYAVWVVVSVAVLWLAGV